MASSLGFYWLKRLSVEEKGFLLFRPSPKLWGHPLQNTCAPSSGPRPWQRPHGWMKGRRSGDGGGASDSGKQVARAHLTLTHWVLR